MWNSKGKISVIVPAYNIEKYIGDCLTSLINQTYSNIEIIVVDDGSSDGTLKVIQSFAEKDNRIIPVHKQNGGVSKARLAGIKIATGDYIGFIDGDDTADDDMYEFLLNNMLSNNCDISHCGYKMVFNNDRIDYYHNSKVKKIQDNETGLYDLLEGKIVEPGLWNKLYSKDLFNSLEKDMDYSIRYNEDLLMNFYLFSNSKKSIFVDECKYNYKQRVNSATSSTFNEDKFYHPLKVRQIFLNKTKYNSALYNLAYSRYVAYLVGNVNNIYPKSLQNEICALLKKEKQNIFNSNMSKKLKLMTVGAVNLRHIYVLVRMMHSKFSGNDKKYEVK